MKQISFMRNSRLLKTTALFATASLLALSVLGFSGCGKKAGPAGEKQAGKGPASTPVIITYAKLGTLSRTVTVTGNLEALQDVSLAARISARVTEVFVREGDHVVKGQALVQQDTTDLQATVNQARANLQNAISQVAQAKINYEIEYAQAKQTVIKDQAAVDAAQYNYSKVKQGNRPPQILQAQATAEQAKATLDNAQTTLTRNKSLFAQGAIAKADLDTAQTTYNVDVQQYNNAKAALALVNAGSYPQDIKFAAEQTKEAQATLKNDQANLKTIHVRQEQITAAEAGVTQAKATVAYDQQQVAYATIRSPIDGIVAARQTEPGQIASSAATIMRIVNVRTMYYEPTISETDFSQTKIGDPVQVNVDALPGKTYVGKVIAVYPAASASNRVFSLRVSIDDPRYELRPGMFARGSIITAVHRNVVVVPITALVPVESAAGLSSSVSSTGLATGGTTLPPQQVYLAGKNNEAVARLVKVGIVTATQAEITGGLKEGDPLITDGQDLLNAGSPIVVENKPNKGHNSSSADVASL